MAAAGSAAAVKLMMACHCCSLQIREQENPLNEISHEMHRMEVFSCRFVVLKVR